jgi:hypothetical protein
MFCLLFVSFLFLIIIIILSSILALPYSFALQQNLTPDTKKDLLSFSYFLAIGNMDEAYKSVKRITETSAIWENMAQVKQTHTHTHFFPSFSFLLLLLILPSTLLFSSLLLPSFLPLSDVCKDEASGRRRSLSLQHEEC